METTGCVWADYHQFYLASPNQDEVETRATATALLDPLESGGAVITTGVRLGEVKYAVRVGRAAPPDLATGWEDIVEATVRAPDGVLKVLGWGAMSVDEINLATAGRGAYRVRAYAKNRLHEYDISSLKARELYLFEIWPADGTEPPVVVLRDSGFASG